MSAPSLSAAVRVLPLSLRACRAPQPLPVDVQPSPRVHGLSALVQVLLPLLVQQRLEGGAQAGEPGRGPGRRRRPRSASSRASAMISSSSMTASMRSEERTPDWAWPRTSPSRRCSRSMRESSKPSRVDGHRVQPLAGRARLGHLGDQEAQAGGRATADAAAQLVELGDAEPVGVHDHHRGGVRHVHPDLDDRRRDQDVRLARGEAAHHGVLVVGLHPAVQDLDLEALERARWPAGRRCRGRRAAGASRPRPPADFFFLAFFGSSSSSPMRGQTTYA